MYVEIKSKVNIGNKKCLEESAIHNYYSNLFSKWINKADISITH